MKKKNTMQSMALGQDKARLQATVTKKEKEIIERLAIDDDRTASNFVGRIVREWLKSNGHLNK